MQFAVGTSRGEKPTNEYSQTPPPAVIGYDNKAYGNMTAHDRRAASSCGFERVPSY